MTRMHAVAQQLIRAGSVLAVLLGSSIPVLAQQQPIPAIPTASTRQPAARSDVELVERLLAARRDYQGALEGLRAYYQSMGDVERTHWCEDEIREFHRINKQAFSLELDVPPPSLHASQNVAEANDLFRRAMSFKDKGWGSDYLDNQRRAEILFQQLLTTYPHSDKIGDAAYQLGDLYEGKAFRQYRRAAQYFERAFQWNPTTTTDARLRAARVYDRQLQERTKAVEIYRLVVAHDTDTKRVAEAQKRLQDLSGTK
jgi:TolA-binding protein